MKRQQAYDLCLLKWGQSAKVEHIEQIRWPIDSYEGLDNASQITWWPYSVGYQSTINRVDFFIVVGVGLSWEEAIEEAGLSVVTRKNIEVWKRVNQKDKTVNIYIPRITTDYGNIYFAHLVKRSKEKPDLRLKKLVDNSGKKISVELDSFVYVTHHEIKNASRLEWLKSKQKIERVKNPQLMKMLNDVKEGKK